MEKKLEGYTLTTFPLPPAMALKAFFLDLHCENMVGFLERKSMKK